jgi:Protein of unknown function (DUF2853)
MSAFDDVIANCQSQMAELGIEGDLTLLTAVAKGLGPSIYNNDSKLVACSDDSELDRVKNNFLIKKLGLADGPELDAAVKGVCEQMSGARLKQRVVFYYLLVKNLGQESHYA